MASFIPPPVRVDGTTIQDVAGVLGLVPGVLAVESVHAGGSSSSGAAGTLLAEIEAAAGKILVNFNGFLKTNLNGAIRLILTFEDATMESVDLNPGSAVVYGVSRYGVQQVEGASALTAWADQTKRVVKVRAETFGTGTSARTAILSAAEVPT